MKKEKKLIEEEGDLNKHSALTTYKVAEGKEFSLQVHKAVNAIYSKEQLILKENFRKETLGIIKEVYPEEEIENIMTYLYTNKSLEFKNKKINLKKLPKIVSDILKYRIEKINWELLDKKTKEDKFLELDSFPLTELALKILPKTEDTMIDFLKIKNNALGLKTNSFSLFSNKEKEEDFQDDKTLNLILSDIKKYAKEITIQKSNKEQQLDFSLLTNMLGANITKLKADLKTAVNTSFQFNYINKKNLDVDVTAAMISSIAFEKGKDVTFLKYQIPEQILNLLLLPDIFVNVKAKVSYKFSTTYTFYLYEFLKDYLYKGEVIVKKDEFLNFINAPKKVRESKYDLQERVLIPSIAELELKSDISVSYEFIPENRWREIKFIITENKKYKEEDIELVRKPREAKKDYKDNERILKALEKAKRNVYVSRSLKKDIYTKINKMYNEYGEDFVVLILNELYKSLNANIKSSLTQYINGMIKNLKAEARQNKKRLSKEMFEKTLKNKIEDIDEDIIPTFKNELDAELFLKNLQESLLKIVITNEEKLKLMVELKKIGKSEKFINIILERYFEIKQS